MSGSCILLLKGESMMSGRYLRIDKMRLDRFMELANIMRAKVVSCSFYLKASKIE
jgi:hypothetical protein